MDNPLLRTATLMLVLAAAACAPALPFQAGAAQGLSYGYSDARLDATHYSVAYADKNAAAANAYLERRAAQIAQTAGFGYFAFDRRGDTMLRRTSSSFDRDNTVMHAHDANGRPFNPMENVPAASGIEMTAYFYAVGQISLLTDAQARANPQALKVSDVLARPDGGTTAR